MALPAIVALLALLEYMFFAYRVGTSRAKYGVVAPAISGNPEWDRMFRVQQNTLEQLIVFLPALWAFSAFVNPMLGAGIGVVFLIGRIDRRLSKRQQPRSVLWPETLSRSLRLCQVIARTFFEHRRSHQLCAAPISSSSQV